MTGADGRATPAAWSTDAVEHYRARIELNSLVDPAAEVLGMLAAYSPRFDRSQRGHLQLTLIVPADDLRQALNTSAAVVDWAIDLEVLALEVGFLTPRRIDIGSAQWTRHEDGLTARDRPSGPVPRVVKYAHRDS